MPPAKEAETVERQWEEISPFTEPISLEVGQEFEAVYLGGNEIDVPARDDDDDETVIVREDGKRRRRAMMHEFAETPDSEPFGVWGSAVLDKRLAEVPAGSFVRVKYEGKQDLDGGRTARRYRVWQDKNAPL